MKRRLKSLVVAVAAVAFVPIAVSTPVAASVADQRNEVQRVVDELDRLGDQADGLAEEYNNALVDQAELDAEIEEAEARIAEKSAEVDQVRSDLADVAVQAYTGADSELLGPLFADAGESGDQLRSDEYRAVALDAGSVSTDDLDEVVSDLEDEQAALDAALDQKKKLIETLADTKKQVDARMTEYKQRRVEAEAKLGELIAEEEQRRAEEAFAAAQAQAAAEAQAAQAQAAQSQAASSSSSSSSSSSGAAPAPVPAPSSPAPSGTSGNAVARARSQLGVPYRWAMASPGVGFDCSGLTLWAWAGAGVTLPHKASSQMGMLPRVSPANAQPGDLVFFGNPATHVGIYAGGGQMIHAPRTGDVVKVSSVSWGRVSAVGRPG